MQARVLQHEVREGSLDTVVIVPGGLTGIRSLDPLADGFAARGVRVVLVEPIANELGGRGQVGDPAYDADTEQDSLHLTVREVGDGGPVHLVGWSNGGRASLAYTGGHPEEVRTVTAVEPPATWLTTDPGGAELEQLMRDVAWDEVPDDALLRFLENVGVAPPGTDYRTFPQWEAWRSVKNTLSWYGRMIGSVQAQFDAHPITRPVLLARGTSTAPWLRDVVDVLARRLADVRVCELAGGHACLLQDMDTFLDASTKHFSVRD